MIALIGYIFLEIFYLSTSNNVENIVIRYVYRVLLIPLVYFCTGTYYTYKNRIWGGIASENVRMNIFDDADNYDELLEKKDSLSAIYKVSGKVSETMKAALARNSRQIFGTFTVCVILLLVVPPYP